MLSALWLLLLPACEPTWPHAGSQSITQIEIDGDGTLLLSTRLQVLSILEVLPELDGDQNGFVDPPEVNAQSGAIQAYWEEHFRLSVQGHPIGEAECRVVLLPPSPGAFLDVSEWVHLECRYPGFNSQTLEVQSDLFLVTSPDHRDHLTVRWSGCLAQSKVVDSATNKVRFEPGASLLHARIAGVLHAVQQGGAGLLSALAVLLAWASGRRRWQHALALGLGAGAGVWMGEMNFALPGTHLLPLALPLGAAYVAADRAAFGMQRSHLLEALALGLLWGLVGGAAELPLELRLAGHGARGAMLGAWAAMVCALALALVRPKPKLGRWVLAATAALGLGLFVARAFVGRSSLG